MSYSRGQYYEQSSRSRSRDRKYRREYRDDGYRYSSSYGGGGGGGSEYAGGRSGGGSYGAGRRSSRPSHAVESQSHHHGGGGGSEYDESKFVLAVFNLSIYTTESELYDVFSKFGPLKKATVVIDAKVIFDPG
uniref:Putative secreted protein n=1 Tax=Aedes albopictus TaxID=7160 RepID=A0A023EFT4_AEDAL